MIVTKLTNYSEFGPRYDRVLENTGLWPAIWQGIREYRFVARDMAGY